MTEYIDKWQAVANLMDARLKDTAKAVDAIQFMPAADVRDNVKAEWTLISKDYEFADGSKSAWNRWECSCCGYCRTAGWEYTSAGKKPKAELCEMCGADMNGGNDAQCRS